MSPRIPTGLQSSLAAFLRCITRSLEDDSSDNTGFRSRYRVPAREQYPSLVTALGVSGTNANHIQFRGCDSCVVCQPELASCCNLLSKVPQTAVDQDSAWENDFRNKLCVTLSSLVDDQLKEKSSLKLDMTKQHQFPCFGLLWEG